VVLVSQPLENKTLRSNNMNSPLLLDIPGIRPISIQTGFNDKVPSALICQGKTQVLCTASYEDKVPPFIKEQKDKKLGWLRAEYNMLPTAGGNQRQQRERSRYNSRSLEIERFIGRALRTSVNLKTLGNRTITIDCDVLVADGGTRCASVIGGIVALHLMLRHLVFEQIIPQYPDLKPLSAISIGLKDGKILLDMNYEQDLHADADINVISDVNGHLIETTAFVEGKSMGTKQFYEAVQTAVEANNAIIEALTPLFSR
jgi:ribonuclease PH